jgi:putative membrane protein insertion efficiency factor
MMMWPVLILSFLISLCPVCATAEDRSFDPWDNQVVGSLSKNEESLTAPASLLIKSVRFYQDHISPVIGERCPMTPSCSAYSVSAIKKHGFFIGIVMTADRLIHENDETASAPAVEKDDGLKFYDPVENNDFWWASKKE